MSVYPSEVLVEYIKYKKEKKQRFLNFKNL